MSSKVKHIKVFGAKITTRNFYIIGLGIVAIFILMLLGFKYSDKIQLRAETPPKYLIAYGIDDTNGANPSYLANNIADIESRFPMWDGVGITGWGYSDSIMTSTPVSTDQIKAGMADLFNMTTAAKKLNHNFMVVYTHNPGTIDNDTAWTTVAANYAHLAQAIVDLNAKNTIHIDGIIYDNEGPYDGSGAGYFDCNNSKQPACNDTNLSNYFVYARNQGYRVMKGEKPNATDNQGVVDIFPGIKFMTFQGIYQSCKKIPDLGVVPDGIANNVYRYNELLGAFTLGLAEGTVNTPARVIDGGEDGYYYNNTSPYTYQGNFQRSFSFRDSEMLTYKDYDGVSLSCSFIPEADKTNWSSLFDKGFGISNTSLGGQTAASIKNNVTYAMNNSSNYVWFYDENRYATFIGNKSGTGLPALDENTLSKDGIYTWHDWWQSIRDGKNVVVPPTSPSPSITITPSIINSPSGSSLKPDLVITGVTMTPASPAVGNKVSFDVTIKNQGTAATPQGALGDGFLGATWKIDGVNVVWSDTNYAPLAAGASITLKPNYGPNPNDLTWAATTGTHTLLVQADNAGKIAELDENNNNWSKTFTVNADVAQPAPPSNLSVSTASRTGLRLRWTDNSNNETGFYVYRGLTASGPWTIIPLGANTTSFTDSGLTRNTIYYYKVSAYNSVGESAQITGSGKTKR